MSLWQSLDPVLSVRLVLVALAVFLFLLAALTWERRYEAPEASSFALLLLGGALYTFAYSEEASATTLPHAVFWLHIEFLALPFIPPLWLLTAIRHNGERFSLSAIFAIPVLCFVAHFTNHRHDWFYLSVDFVRDGPFWELSFKRGPFALLENTYLLFSFVAAAWLYITQMRNGSRLFRKQAMIMLASSVLPVAFYFLYLTGLSPWHLDITPFSFPLCAALYYYGVFSLGVFDLTPTARNLVFQGMRDAVLILDNRSRLLDFNAAATHLLPLLGDRSVGAAYRGDAVELSLPALLPDRSAFGRTAAGRCEQRRRRAVPRRARLPAAHRRPQARPRVDPGRHHRPGPTARGTARPRRNRRADRHRQPPPLPRRAGAGTQSCVTAGPARSR